MTGGSCLWEAVVNDSRVAEVIRPPSGLQCSQMTLSPKGLGTTLVTVYDIGVSPPLSALAVVSCYSGHVYTCGNSLIFLFTLNMTMHFMIHESLILFYHRLKLQT